MKTKIFVILISCFLKVLPQDSIVGTACSLEDPPNTANILIRQCVDPQNNDILNAYLKEIKVALNQRNAPYAIKILNVFKDASALLIRVSNTEYLRAIAVNETYYSGKVEPIYQRAMFLWIIGHEITHHINADDFHDNNIELKNLSQELLADENGGYVLGKLTNNISLDKVGEIIENILTDNDTSIFHPKKCYRVYAAKAGWLRAKTEKWANNTRDFVLNTKIQKINFGDSLNVSTTINVVNDFDSLELTRNEYSNGNFYYGFGHKDGRSHGDGVMMIYNNDSIKQIDFGNYFDENPNGKFKSIREYEKTVGNFKSGHWTGKGTDVRFDKTHSFNGKYTGTYENSDRSGYGTNYYRNGDVYFGEWANDKRNGFGVLYHDTVLISSGCWRDDVIISNRCKE